MQDCIAGRSAVWHDKYSRHYTKVFGYIACRTTARITGSGGAERGWSDNKVVKSGKRAHLSSDKLRKQGTLYTSSNVRRARIKRTELEKPDCKSPHACWGDDDEQFDLGLKRWGVDVDALKKPLGITSVVLVFCGGLGKFHGSRSSDEGETPQEVWRVGV